MNDKTLIKLAVIAGIVTVVGIDLIGYYTANARVGVSANKAIASKPDVNPSTTNGTES